ncbi:protein phosphatase 2C domain-containing protein [Streptomyces sp. SCSIO 30461]|uniref:PP2C family protein-serine/threonine phosphatase n=1 Tax=Streptomyces sp. SCSIO 30461 TaxID=3118085 RepID=UPI0030D46A35
MPYIAVTALSDIGLVREHNEDSLVAGPWTLCATVTENPQTLLFPLGTPLVVAVADGLGGQPAGEVASALVVHRLAALGPGLGGEQAVRDALDLCNHSVYAAAEADPKLTAMGTTIAGAVVLPDSVLVFNVGDSKVYEVGAADGEPGPRGERGDAGERRLRQVSVDDSPLPAPGRRTTSAVTQTLGGSLSRSPIIAHVSRSPLAVGDRWLICSDGLTDPVPDEELDDLLSGHDGGRAAYELWKAAIESGGPDNITLALIRIGAGTG